MFLYNHFKLATVHSHDKKILTVKIQNFKEYFFEYYTSTPIITFLNMKFAKEKKENKIQETKMNKITRKKCFQDFIY